MFVCCEKELEAFNELYKKDADLSTLETPIKQNNLFSFSKKQYYLFAKSGFTKGCANRAKELGNVTLVAYEDII